jgi:hypothetical protein
MMLDSIASLAIAAKLSTSMYSPVNFNSFSIAKTEVREGMYKEYTIDVDETQDRVCILFSLLRILWFRYFNQLSFQFITEGYGSKKLQDR